jgi:hypothetical protein
VKRGVSNFIGELSKILLGTMDDDCAKYYDERTIFFEQNSEDMVALLKQQLNVIKSSFGAVNNILTDVEFNGMSIREGTSKIKIICKLWKQNRERNLIFSIRRLKSRAIS